MGVKGIKSLKDLLGVLESISEKFEEKGIGREDLEVEVKDGGIVVKPAERVKGWRTALKRKEGEVTWVFDVSEVWFEVGE